jgi:hypothetical protein
MSRPFAGVGRGVRERGWLAGWMTGWLAGWMLAAAAAVVVYWQAHC